MISIINAGIKTMLGDGSAGNPYQIRTAKQLYDFSVCVNAGNDCTNQYFIQTADIDLSGYANWTPIGTSTNRFAGEYNGNGFSIYNLVATGARVGLFGYISGGTLKNINIQSGTVTGVSGSSVIGAVCCATGTSSTSTISGCVNRASIVGVSMYEYCYLGGIVGYHASSNAIVNCANFGAITQNSTTSGLKLAGGIVGTVQSSANAITTCFNAGAITGNGTLKAISGATATLSNCYFDSTVSGASDAAATGRATADCQGTDALTNANKLNNLGTVNWFARSGDYPLPIRFNK